MRRFTEGEVLSGIVRQALGAGAHVVGVERLRGGSKKGVYRVRTQGSRAGSVIVYSWAEEENFWPAAVLSMRPTRSPRPRDFCLSWPLSAGWRVLASGLWGCWR